MEFGLSVDIGRMHANEDSQRRLCMLQGEQACLG